MNQKQQLKAVLITVSIPICEVLIGALITMVLLSISDSNTPVIRLLSKLSLVGTVLFLYKNYPQAVRWKIDVKASTLLVLAGCALYGWIVALTYHYVGITQTYDANINFFISALIIAPIFQELLFRGWMIPYLSSKGINITAVIIITAIISYAWQGTWMEPHTIVNSIALGYIYLKSKSITLPILAHLLFNVTHYLLNTF